MTFQVTDALISPMGLAVLSGAGLFSTDDKVIHVHATKTVSTNASTGVATISYAELAEELGINDGSDIYVCDGATGTGAAYATVVDATGYGYAWPTKALTITGAAAAVAGLIAVKKGNSVTFTPDTADKDLLKGKTIKIDFYVAMKSGATEITIEPDSFGGFFYVEADTLFRREDNGQDMSATLTFPRVKIQSGFTFSMAATGDPSTFDFVMDAFPATTQFDSTKKVCVVMDIVGADKQVGVADETPHPDHKE